MRVLALSVFGLSILASPALAQAPPAGPLVLQVPATPRTAALGNAWVAGRDQDVLFYNPAQIVNARTGFDLSYTHHGPDAGMVTMGSVYASGKWSMTFGWGAEILRFGADPFASGPLSTHALHMHGSAEGVSALFAVGGAIVFKGFRIGAAGKYVFDSVPASGAGSGTATPLRGALVADIGASRNLWGGTFAGSVQNLGPHAANGSALALPRQTLVGWSMTRGAGPIDLGLYTQLTMRHDWTAPGAGLEAGYSWIEGYNVALRVGVRRPETTTEKPVSLGAAFTADRLTVEYAVQIFDGGHAAQGVTFRWR